MLAQHRRAASGVLLVCMVIATTYVGFSPSIHSFQDFWLSGIFAFLAALLLLPDTNSAQRIQLSVLVSIGVLLLFIGISRGAQVNWSGLMSQNTGLLSMLMSVGLLKLVISGVFNSASNEIEKLPVGRKAFWQTLMSVTLFGSVINISAAVLISDRLTLNRPMDYFTAATVVRAYSACAAWSPFFACMAVALTAVGDFNLLVVMAAGLPLTIASVIAIYVSARIFKSEKLDAFRGYPIKVDSLLVPFILTLMVASLSLLMPQVSILSIIALSSFVLTSVFLTLSVGLSSAIKRLRDYAVIDLPKTINELLLFMSAGILASGLLAMVQSGSIEPPIDNYNGLSASVLLGAMVVIAGLGIHPVIQIAAITPLILSVNPNPELLGLTYVFSWSLGTCASPLSGTNLIMQGRYAVSAWRVAVGNWPYISFMYCIASMLLFILDAMTSL